MSDIHRVWCINVNCEKCRKAVFVKTGILGDRYYSCPPIPKKHKVIDARNCMEFRCSEKDEYSLCEHCSGGAPVKRLRRY